VSDQKQSVDESGLTFNNEQDDWREAAPDSAGIKDRIRRQVDEIFRIS
jgi:hypothetical protein